MNLMATLFAAALFFVLTPGVFLKFPPGGSKKMMALVHAVVFALIFDITHKAVWSYFKYEGFLTADEINRAFSNAEAKAARTAAAAAAKPTNEALAKAAKEAAAELKNIRSQIAPQANARRNVLTKEEEAAIAKQKRDLEAMRYAPIPNANPKNKLTKEEEAAIAKRKRDLEANNTAPIPNARNRKEGFFFGLW